MHRCTFSSPAKSFARVNAAPGIVALTDLGCGTGAAGAAWALECAECDVTGADRNAWATAEAQWTYRTLGLRGRAFKADIDGMRLSAGAGRAILAAYTVNELPDPVRAALLPRLLEAHQQGTRILIVEPIARRLATWWTGWEKAFTAAGGTPGEWRFAVPLPERQHQLGRAAGLDPARTHGQIALALRAHTVLADHDQFRSRPVVRGVRIGRVHRSTSRGCAANSLSWRADRVGTHPARASPCGYA